MKKIVNGKRYDTETATGIASWSNNLGTSDFHYIEEILYRTKNSNWFLYVEGGATSKYSSPQGSARGYGRDIIPLTIEETQEWLEKHDEVEVLEKYFVFEDA